MSKYVPNLDVCKFDGKFCDRSRVCGYVSNGRDLKPCPRNPHLKEFLFKSKRR